MTSFSAEAHESRRNGADPTDIVQSDWCGCLEGCSKARLPPLLTISCWAEKALFPAVTRKMRIASVASILTLRSSD